MKVVTAKAKELTPKLASQFGTLKAKRKELEKEEKALIPKIKALMVDEEEDVTKSRTDGTNGRVVTYIYGPDVSPFQLEYSQFQTTDVSWKDEFQRMYVERFGEKAYEKFVAGLPTKDADKLEAKPNPNYKGGQ